MLEVGRVKSIGRVEERRGFEDGGGGAIKSFVLVWGDGVVVAAR